MVAVIESPPTHPVLQTGRRYHQEGYRREGWRAETPGPSHMPAGVAPAQPRSGEPQGQPGDADTELVQTLRTRVALLETQLLAREADATRDHSLPSSPEGIAVVGAGCRFPGDVSSLDELWTLLCEGKDAISNIPPARFDVEEYFDTDAATQGTMNVRVGGFLAQPLDHFDTAAFSMAPREARHLDPQQR